MLRTAKKIVTSRNPPPAILITVISIQKNGGNVGTCGNRKIRTSCKVTGPIPPLVRILMPRGIIRPFTNITYTAAIAKSIKIMLEYSIPLFFITLKGLGRRSIKGNKNNPRYTVIVTIFMGIERSMAFTFPRFLNKKAGWEVYAAGRPADICSHVSNPIKAPNPTIVGNPARKSVLKEMPFFII
jgi:hypothetical protein